MPSAHASRHPLPLFQRSTSSSLIGMETPLSKSTPRLGNSQSSINLATQLMKEKPLPPTPRKTSSVYSVQRDGMKNVRTQTSSDALLPPHTTLQPTAYRASTSRVLEATSKRPKLTQDFQAHAISDPVLEMRQQQQQQQEFEKTDTRWRQSPIPRMESDFAAPSYSINKYLTASNNGTKGAEEYASNYESLLHTRSSALPIFTPEPYSNYDYLPSPMSPRITDVVDRSLLPLPLNYSTLEEQERPSSTFSSSSSDLDGFHNGIRGSLRAYARKALHLRKTELDGKDRKNTSSTLKSETSHVVALAARPFGKKEPVAVPRRGSIQQGISSTLAKLSITSQQPRPKPVIDLTGATRTRVPRELRSPAIPVTPYQQLGKKAWQSSRSSKKSQSPSFKSARTSNVSHLPGEQTSYFSDPPGKRTSHSSSSPCGNNSTVKSNTSIATIPGSIAKKITSAFHTRTAKVDNAMESNKETTRLTKSEQRREELKKKIVVIRVGDRN